MAETRYYNERQWQQIVAARRSGASAEEAPQAGIPLPHQGGDPTPPSGAFFDFRGINGKCEVFPESSAVLAPEDRSAA